MDDTTIPPTISTTIPYTDKSITDYNPSDINNTYDIRCVEI